MSAVIQSFGSPSANMLIATAMFVTAASVSQSLEINDSNRRLIERKLYYTPAEKPGPAETTISVKTLLVFFLAVTGVFHVIYSFTSNRPVALRFIEYSITASVMMMIIQLLSGEDNGDLVVACAALIATTMFFGLVQDDRVRSRSTSTKAFYLGWIPFVVAWFFVIKRFFFSLSLSDKVPDFVRWIIWGELALFSCFALVQYFFIVRPMGSAIGAETSGNENALMRYAGAYNLLSITAKMFLALMAFFGLKNMNG